MIFNVNYCKQTVFIGDNLPALMREVADFVEGKGVVWDVIVDAQRDRDGDYFIRVMEHDPSKDAQAVPQT
jgi:hypothetical protein